MARNRRETKILFIHCSATKARQDIGARTINVWHENAGIYSDRGLTGYHFVGRRSGAVEIGRELNETGAHVLGWNDISIGYCLVGGARKAKPGEAPEWADMVAVDNFVGEQFIALAAWYRALLLVYPGLILAPHWAVSAKACPSFDAWEWQREEFGHDDRLRFAEFKAGWEGDS